LVFIEQNRLTGYLVRHTRGVGDPALLLVVVHDEEVPVRAYSVDDKTIRRGVIGRGDIAAALFIRHQYLLRSYPVTGVIFRRCDKPGIIQDIERNEEGVLQTILDSRIIVPSGNDLC